VLVHWNYLLLRLANIVIPDRHNAIGTQSGERALEGFSVRLGLGLGLLLVGIAIAFRRARDSAGRN
jgi:hypothetical protein